MYGVPFGDILDASRGDPGGIWGHPGGVWGDAQAAQAQEGLPGGSEGTGLIKVVPLSVNLPVSEKTCILLSVFEGQLTVDRYLR